MQLHRAMFANDVQAFVHRFQNIVCTVPDVDNKCAQLHRRMWFTVRSAQSDSATSVCALLCNVNSFAHRH